jgi:hypothetical protein
MDNTEGDEWEYEYDAGETEDFYVTLDLSGTLSIGREGIDPAYLPSLERRRKMGRPSYKTVMSRPPTDSYVRPRHLESPEPASQSDTDDDIDSSRIQILDLHTSNPLIAYEGQILSCHWASTVGTDMLFRNTEPDSSSQVTPLRKFPAFDLLGLSSTKLMAATAQIRPRDHILLDDKEPTPVPDEAMRRRSSTTPNPGGVRRLLPSSRAKINQQNFLNRLGAANAKRAKRKRDEESWTALPMRRGPGVTAGEGVSAASASISASRTSTFGVEASVSDGGPVEAASTNS